jgi:hypothetical protein
MASRILLGDGPVEVTDDVFEDLQRLHPPEDPGAFRGRLPKQPLVPCRTVTDVVLGLPEASAPGPSGWTYAMIKRAWREEEDGKSFRKVMEAFAWRLTKGREVAPLGWFKMARLIPLRKDSGGARPIACGEAFTRVIARWALSGVRKDVLLDSQYGVWSAGGVEPMVWALTDEVLDSADGGVQCLDFVNAFGTMRRSVIAQQVREHVPELWGIAKLLYDTPSDLYLQTGTGIRCIKSQSGVKQGDPFGPLFYSLGMRPLLDWIKEQNVSGRAYLDDVHNTRITQEQAEEILDAIPLLPEGIRAGLVVNRAKSWYKTYRDLHREGRKVLGTFVGGLTHEGAHLMDSRIERFLERTRECGGLGLQHRLLLLRFCFFPTFNRLLRTIHPDIIRPFAVAFDNAVIDTIA